MNHRYTIAQPCFFSYHNTDAPARPNLQREFVLFDEIETLNEEVVLWEKLKRPISIFTEVHKAIYDTETWKDYGYYLVAYDVGIKDIFHAIRKRHVWPNRLIAFGDDAPTDAENLVTYDDDYVIVGLGSPKNVRLYKRRDR